MPYPTTFPTLLQTSDDDCGYLTGAYEPIGIASDTDPDWLAGRRPQLLQKLGSGISGWRAPVDITQARIETSDAGLLSAFAVLSDLTERQVDIPTADYACDAGILSITRQNIPSVAEGCSDIQRSVTLRIQSGVDRSLVIKMENSFRGYCFVLVPSKTEEIYWFNFRRLD